MSYPQPLHGEIMISKQIEMKRRVKKKVKAGQDEDLSVEEKNVD